jgi:hypothetical protein
MSFITIHWDRISFMDTVFAILLLLFGLAALMWAAARLLEEIRERVSDVQEEFQTHLMHELELERARKCCRESSASCSACRRCGGRSHSPGPLTS